MADDKRPILLSMTVARASRKSKRRPFFLCFLAVSYDVMTSDTKAAAKFYGGVIG